MAKPKRPRDTNQLAKFIVDISIGEASDTDPNAGKDPAAIERGKLGGAKGGLSRAKSLSPTKRKRIAKRAAQARWGRKTG